MDLWKKGRHARAPEPEPIPVEAPVEAHSHGHSHGHGPAAPSTHRGRVLLIALLAPCLVAVLAGLLLLWPDDAEVAVTPGNQAPVVYEATVTAARQVDCQGGGGTCLEAQFRLDEGPREGTAVTLELDPRAGQPAVDVGQGVLLGEFVDTVGDTTYVLQDLQRGPPLLLLGLLTAVVVVGVARWRGLAAILGVGITAYGLVVFVLPALLEGEPPVAVAMVGAGALLPLLLYLAHGFSARTSSALAGTLLSLALCAGLSVLAVSITDLTGLSSDEAVSLQGLDSQVDITQLLICGFIIGALGALNDVTITQASAVWELAGTGATAREAYSRAMRIGRDHIASSVYTLVFAYAGSALPLLLVFVVIDRPALDVLTSDLIAVELVRTIVGTIGLVASVPLTTAIAAFAATEARDRRAKTAA